MSVSDVVNSEQTDRRSVEERREQLIDAAIQVLATEGLGRATTRNITEQANLALGAFHYAFRSKDELLESVIERVVSATERVLQDAVEDVRDDPNRAIPRMLEEFWDFIDETPDLQLAQYELTVHALRNPKMRRLAVDQHRRYTDAIRGVLEQVPNGPEGQDAQDLARYVAATMDGLVLHRLVEEDVEAGRRRLRLHQTALQSLVQGGSEQHGTMAS
jgi:AcrR family transcriptional regulator